MALTKINASVIANNTIAVGNIADNSVDATKIASNSILTRHIDDNQIGIDQLNVSDGSSGQALTTNGSGTLSFASAGETNRLPLAGGTLTGNLTGTQAFFSPNTAGKNTITLTTNASDDGRILIKSNTTDKVDIQANGASYFNGGNVGIGTTSPSFRLHVLDTIGTRTLSLGHGVSSGTITTDSAKDLDFQQAGTTMMTLQEAGHLEFSPVSSFTGLNNSILASSNNFMYMMGGSSGLFLADNSDLSNAIGIRNDNYINFNTNDSERLRIDSSGKVGIGTASPSNLLHASGTGSTRLQIDATDNNAAGAGLYMKVLNSGSLVGNATVRVDNTGNLDIFTGTSSESQKMTILAGGNVGINCAASNAKLEVVATSGEIFRADANSGAYRIFADQNGVKMNGNVGIGDTSPAGQLEVRNTTNQPTGIFAHEANNLGSYNDIVSSSTFTANSVNHQYFVCKSGNGSAISDIEFNLRGDGNAYADGSWSGGGADYAEYFEWADGNSSSQDRVGYSVSLVNNKIKIAESGETVIGVISGNPAVVGDNSWNSWKDKYQKDDYGRYIRNSDGHRISNPDYDDTLDYVKREDRKEWDIVGLMGKLRIKKGQQTGTNWIKMRDISASVEEWLVR